MMPPGFSSVRVSSRFWIHEQYGTTYCHGCILHPPGPCTWPSNHHCSPWKNPAISVSAALFCTTTRNILPISLATPPKGHWTFTLCPLLYFVSQIWFPSRPISHNCFPYTPKPPPCKIKTSCFQCGLLGCTPHLWPSMVLSSLCYMRGRLPHPGSACCSQTMTFASYFEFPCTSLVVLPCSTS